MLPGTAVYMSEKSAYLNTFLLTQWISECFIPRKPNGIILLVLDGHLSHCTPVALLELAEANYVVMVCLSSPTMRYLQPLNRAIFKMLKKKLFL